MMPATMSARTTVLAKTVALFRGNGQILFGMLILLVLGLLAVSAPLVAAYDPAKTDVLHRLMPPSLGHFFGTDAFGRDVFSRCAYGARYSLSVGGVTMLATTIIGTAIGVFSGYLRGVVDLLVMRSMEAFLALPAILLAIALVAIFGNGLTNLVIALSIAYIPRLALIARNMTLSISEELYVESARAIGARPLRVVFHYILPQLLPAIFVQSSFIFAYAVISEAGLSFLGVGVQPPAPSWGGILSDGRTYMGTAPWITVFPGISIMLVVLALNQLGDGLRDSLDPRLKRISE